MHGCFLRLRFAWLFWAAISFALAQSSFSATTNRWTNSVSGLWQTGSNWSSNVPPNSTFTYTPITNGNTKTVTVDATTPATNLTVNTLTVSAPGGFTNTLQLTDLTNQALHLNNTLNINRGGALSMTNSTLSVAAIGQFNLIGGTAVVESGLLDCSTANLMRVGRFATNSGDLTVNGGTVLGTDLQVGQDGAQGTLLISNGLVNLTGFLSLGYSTPNSTGIVTVAGGQLRVTNDVAKIGDRGVGQMSLSGGAADFAFLSVGDLPDSQGMVSVSGGQLTVRPRSETDTLRLGNGGTGELDVSGGAVVLLSEVILGDNGGGAGNGTGTILMTGGQFFATNDLTSIGKFGMGTMTVSNGFVQLTNVSVGRHDGAVGTLNVQSNAQMLLVDDLSIGRFSNGVGHVFVTGGLLALTNDSIWVGREGIGDMTLSNGTTRARGMFVAMSTVTPDPNTGDPVTNVPAGTLALAGGNLVLSSNLLVGTDSISTGQVSVVGGTLTITNSASSGHLVIASGTFTMTQGTIVTDNLLVTNATGQFIFNGGTVQAKGAVVSNGLPFIVGDSVNPATLQLLGGSYSFANGLVVSSNATISGCGTIQGSISNFGTIATNCGPAGPVITSITKTGDTTTVFFTTLNGSNYVLEYKNTLNDASWAAILPVVIGNGSVISKTDTNATVINRFYRIHLQ